MALHGLFRSCVAAIASALVATVTLTGPAQDAKAAEFKAHDITIEAPWSRATPGGAKVGAGYLIVRNAGATPDWLVAATSSIAERVEIHQMSMTDGMMKMRQATGGVEVPAGSAVALAPGGSGVVGWPVCGRMRDIAPPVRYWSTASLPSGSGSSLGSPRASRSTAPLRSRATCVRSTSIC